MCGEGLMNVWKLELGGECEMRGERRVPLEARNGDWPPSYDAEYGLLSPCV